MKTRNSIVVFLCTVLVMSSFVSANHAWWHPWGEEVKEAPFDASVQLANSPPTIVKLFPVYDRTTGGVAQGADNDGEVTPVAALSADPGFVFAVVKFIVDDPNHLPGTPDLSLAPAVITMGSQTATVSQAAVQITSPPAGILCTGPGCRNRDAATGIFPTGATAACTGTNCGGVVANNCNDGAGASLYGSLISNRQVEYTCYVRMSYFDEQTVGAGTLRNQYWDIGLYIEDISGNGPIAVRSIFFDPSPGVFSVPSDEDLYVDVNRVDGMDVNTGEFLQWLGASVTATDLPATDANGADADGGLTFRDRGNSVVASSSLTPQDLTGNIVGTARLLAASMSTDFGLEGVIGTNVGACDAPGGGGPGTAATALVGGTTFSAIEGFTIPFTATGTNQDELYFCIWPRLDTGCGGTCLTSGSDSSYSANDPCGASCNAAGEQWEIVPTFS